MPLKVTKDHFAASGRLFGPNGLTDVIRKMAIDNAKRVLQVAAILDFTDNSTGVSTTKISDMVIPLAAFDATVAGGAQRASFNSTLLLFENATKVIGNAHNLARTRLDLGVLVLTNGTEVTPSTIPAQTKVVTTANGAAAIDFAGGVVAMTAMKANLQKLIWSHNEITTAMGAAPLIQTPWKAPKANTPLTLAAIAAAPVSATGALSISKVAMDLFLDTSAANIAYMAANWNSIFGQAGAAPTGITVIAG